MVVGESWISKKPEVAGCWHACAGAVGPLALSLGLDHCLFTRCNVSFSMEAHWRRRGRLHMQGVYPTCKSCQVIDRTPPPDGSRIASPSALGARRTTHRCLRQPLNRVAMGLYVHDWHSRNLCAVRWAKAIKPRGTLRDKRSWIKRVVYRRRCPALNKSALGHPRHAAAPAASRQFASTREQATHTPFGSGGASLYRR